MLKNWSIVWFGNLIGALLIAILVIFSTNHAVDYLNLVHTTALNKVNLTPLNCFISGILCNTLVCLAVYTAQCAKSAAGKILGIVFPITTFIIAGYEHSVANMFFIPSGIMVQKIRLSYFFIQNYEYIWKYLNKFSKFNMYIHKENAFIEGNEANIPFNLNSVYKVFPKKIGCKIRG